MPQKHPNTERIGGPGAAHENRKHPEKTQESGPPPNEKKLAAFRCFGRRWRARLPSQA